MLRVGERSGNMGEMTERIAAFYDEELSRWVAIVTRLSDMGVPLSIDDFVVTQYMSSNSSTTTIPMYLYSNARGGTSTPALNALATILVAVTLIGIVLAYLLYTVLGLVRDSGIRPGENWPQLAGLSLTAAFRR